MDKSYYRIYCRNLFINTNFYMHSGDLIDSSTYIVTLPSGFKAEAEYHSPGMIYNKGCFLVFRESMLYPIEDITEYTLLYTPPYENVG